MILIRFVDLTIGCCWPHLYIRQMYFTTPSEKLGDKHILTFLTCNLKFLNLPTGWSQQNDDIFNSGGIIYHNIIKVGKEIGRIKT